MLNHWPVPGGFMTLAEDPLPTSTVDQVLAPYVYIFYAAFLISYCFTPMMRQIALYYRVIDNPDLNRKLHKEPVAYLGGVAVFLGWIGGLAVSQFVQKHRVDTSVPHLRWPFAIVIAASMIVLLGLWDDVKKVNPWLKIFMQVAAAVMLLTGGIGTHTTGPLLSPLLNRYTISHPVDYRLYNDFVFVSSSLLTVVLVVGCCNAANLMDGLDGLCGGVSAIIAAGFTFLAVHMATYGTLVGDVNTEGMRIVLGLALLGAVLGFVPFNFNPASIFLGDTGSMFIGFSFAVLLAMMAEERSKWFLSGIVMFALPVLDTALAFVRRWVNKRPIFSADRHHLHHQMMARGFTVRQTVVLSYAMAVVFVILGAAIAFMRTRYVVAAYMVIFGSIIVAAYKSGFVHEKAKVDSPKGIQQTDTTLVAGFGSGDGVLEVPDFTAKQVEKNSTPEPKSIKI